MLAASAAAARSLYVLRADDVPLLLDATTGARLSSTRLWFDGFLIGAADGVALLASAGDVVAVDARSGRTRWRTDIGAERVNDGLLADGTLWIHATDSHTNRDPTPAPPGARRLAPADRWFGRLRDAYLEPWDGGAAGVFLLAIRVGRFAHAFAWARQRDHLPHEARPQFDKWFGVVLRRAVAQTLHCENPGA